MTSRTATRDALLRQAGVLTSAATVLTLTATGAVLGRLASTPAAPLSAPTAPAATAAQVTPQRVEPRPRRTVYVRVPAGVVERRAPVRKAVVRPPVRAPQRVQAPPATTSSGS